MKSILKTLILTGLFLFQGQLLSAQQETTVSFTSPYNNNGWQLEGTLTVPSGNGPFPVAIFIHGSGPSDRDQTVVPTAADSCSFPGLVGDTIRWFKTLAYELAQIGVASLRYDKITFTYGSQMDPFDISPYDFVNDAGAAVDYVKTRPEIDSNCIILMGHSQGANFLPILAQRRNDIGALVSMAGAAQPIDTILIQQIFYVYDSCQGNPNQAITIANNNRSAFNSVRNGTWPAVTPLAGSGVKFWEDWLDITDSAIINYQNITTPTLFLQGLEDIQVPAENAQMFADSLTRDSVTVNILPGLSHNFTLDTIPELSPLMYDALFVWLGGLTCPTPTGLHTPNREEVGIQYNWHNKQLSIAHLPLEPATLCIVGIDGTLWLQQNLQGNNSFQTTLDGAMPTGMYLVVVESAGSRRVKCILRF